MDARTFLDADTPAPVCLDVPGGVVAVISRRGPGKTVNEDAAAVIPLEGGALVVVADGMGGHQAGERASRAAVEVLARGLSGADPALVAHHALLDGIEAANRAVLALGVGAGATLAAVLVQEGRARSAHVGDAAAVHLGQRGRIKAWTLSHAPTSYAVEAGVMDEEEALHHEDRHLVSNHLGTAGMTVDLGPTIQVAPRDTLLAASDGLLDNLFPEELVDLARKGALAASAAGLAELACKRMVGADPQVPGKPDDVTVVLYRRR